MKRTKRVTVYADERTYYGKEVLDLLEGIPVTHIPLSGGYPFVVRGGSRYDGPIEIMKLVEELNGERVWPCVDCRHPEAPRNGLCRECVTKYSSPKSTTNRCYACGSEGTFTYCNCTGGH